MIMKTIGFRGLAYFQTNPFLAIVHEENGSWMIMMSTRNGKREEIARENHHAIFI